MRLIDADALIRRWCGIKCGCERDECGREIEPCIVVMAIEEAMTIDAVPVVRCGECKWYEAYKSECWLHLDAKAWLPNDFCSDGERKEDDD